jgi:hypothetical protein
MPDSSNYSDIHDEVAKHVASVSKSFENPHSGFELPKEDIADIFRANRREVSEVQRSHNDETLRPGWCHYLREFQKY